jgi:Ca-activated chloride channel family protein
MFQFANPDYLYLLGLIPLIFLAFVLVMIMKRRRLNRLGEPGIFMTLIPDRSIGRQYIKMSVLLLVAGFIILALSRPQLGSKLEKGERKGIDLFICLDVSNSMMAQDIQPDRLSRAKNAVSKMIDELKNDRIGIVIFAGKSYLQLPITTDYAAAKLFVSTITPDLVPTQGTAIGDAINMAVESFDENKHSKAIILITDGENFEDDPVEAAKKANEKGIKVFTVGMGLPEGAPIPVYRNGQQAGFKQDQSGGTVITKLNDEVLQQISASGGGAYVRANNTQSSLDKIFKEINGMQKTEFEAKIFADYEERFQYFLVIALIFLVLEILVLERRNKWLGKIKLFG